MPLIERVKRALMPKRPSSIGGTVIVHDIVRCAPSMWVATVEYRFASLSWPERVAFTRRRADSHDIITVTDADYPGDRKRAFISSRGDDMHLVILGYLLKGRW